MSCPLTGLHWAQSLVPVRSPAVFNLVGAEPDCGPPRWTVASLLTPLTVWEPNYMATRIKLNLLHLTHQTFIALCTSCNISSSSFLSLMWTKHIYQPHRRVHISLIFISVSVCCQTRTQLHTWLDWSTKPSLQPAANHLPRPWERNRAGETAATLEAGDGGLEPQVLDQAEHHLQQGWDAFPFCLTRAVQ